MSQGISGIHHVTAIASDPQRNLDFYVDVLGLRLVKRTVNFDDPGTYHFYFGDGLGHPGTILTFFPWPNARQGQRGTGQAVTTSFSVPAGSLGWWRDRLTAREVPFETPLSRFEEEALVFYDPDGLQLELVAHSGADDQYLWREGPIPAEHALRGFYGVALALEGYERTAALLTETMDFRLLAESGNRYRFQADAGVPGSILDVLCVPVGQRGRVAAGTVHHVAWRTPNDTAQRAWRERFAGLGLNVTPVLDRKYFQSIYFREPGGVLFEIATDTPGFTLDESPDELGSVLRLPSWLEPRRAEIAQALPKLHLPG
jgi:glyoxalase family protein